ncbi:MAG TPA: ABC transporter permease [Thermomicrobiales bacterium]|nr:ABC transporter permease [Thermomicrobiales bacterium]
MTSRSATAITEEAHIGEAVGGPLASSRRRRFSKRQIRLLLWGAPIILFIIIAIAGPILSPYDPITVNTPARLKAPGAILKDGSRTWLGTDQVGREMLPQIMQGARISLLVGGATVLFAGLIGMTLGVLAGFYGGFLDALLMRLADIQLAFPSILFAIMIAGVLGPSVANIIITLSLTRWVIFGRVARAATLAAKERDFVLASKALGAGGPRLLLKHIIPSTLAPLIVIATVEVGLVIIAEASLSFLGLGTPTSQPSWGQTIANGRAYLNTAWWIATVPGIALSLVVLSVGVFGDKLRDYLDPRGRR